MEARRHEMPISTINNTSAQKISEMNMVFPMVSVVMPAYNAEKYIETAILSVICQSYSNWELIIVNDCSHDNTLGIAVKYANIDNRVRIYTNANTLGAFASRQYAVSLASGQWIAFLDADDEWTSDKLQKQLYFAEKNGCDFTFTASSFMDKYEKKHKWIMSVPEKVDYKSLLKQNIISCSSVLIKKNLLLQKFPIGNKPIHEDYVMWLSILRIGRCAYGINEPLLCYRISQSSQSGNKIKSAVMTFNTYRMVGLGVASSLINLTEYTLRSLYKYGKLVLSGKRK